MKFWSNEYILVKFSRTVANLSPVNPEILVEKARKPCCRKETARAAAIFVGLKFADNIHYKFKTSQASKASLQSSKHSGAKQNLTQNGHPRSFN